MLLGLSAIHVQRSVYMLLFKCLGAVLFVSPEVRYGNIEEFMASLDAVRQVEVGTSCLLGGALKTFTFALLSGSNADASMLSPW